MNQGLLRENLSKPLKEVQVEIFECLLCCAPCKRKTCLNGINVKERVTFIYEICNVK